MFFENIIIIPDFFKYLIHKGLFWIYVVYTVSLEKGYGSKGNQYHKHTLSEMQSHTQDHINAW